MKTICNHPMAGRNGAECEHAADATACPLYQPLAGGCAEDGPATAAWKSVCRYVLLVGEKCSHGHLDRSCEACERDARIAELESELANQIRLTAQYREAAERAKAECERLRGASKKAEELGARIVMDALENRGQWGICDELYNQKARDEFIRRALGHDAAADGAERGGR